MPLWYETKDSHLKLYFHYASGFATQILAYMLDSLVRVSRRVNENHFVSISNTHLAYLHQYAASPQAQLCCPKR